MVEPLREILRPEYIYIYISARALMSGGREDACVRELAILTRRYLQSF